MIARFHMKSSGIGHAGVFVEHRDRNVLVNLRASDERFYRARIIHVIQAYPDQIAEGVVYSTHTGKPADGP